ncbi:MAG: dTDP-4-dehydrorhamnose 3,5-epimerase [Robiginitomaculum sp.]
MNITTYTIKDVFSMQPQKFEDKRGFFSETYNAQVFNEMVNTEITFLQDNHSMSLRKNTVRGLHYQTSPYCQGKLVRCVRGSILDVAVDVRAQSPTFGEHICLVLSAQNCRQLWIPEGFLHGFLTLEANTEVTYKVTNYYMSEHDNAVRWNDPTLNIEWGIEDGEAVLSEKDCKAPFFKRSIFSA